ncbi:hypothetical protein KBC70_03710 [Candidatus Woesebacteria bacterium]|nr:hypothetical protein [Candidatus Woesebacteria bacterium]
MITGQYHSILQATKSVFSSLYETSKEPNDLELIKESSAAIEVDLDNSESCIELQNHRFTYNLNYRDYFPYVDDKIIKLELDYWYSEFIMPPRLNNLISYLKENRLSKRAIINFWDDKHRDLDTGAPCTTNMFFRVDGKRLNCHSHMRANNASFLLFMDMHMLSGIQALVAKELGLKTGMYVHFVDSLHFYKKESENIDKQYKFINESDIWKKVSI